MAATLAFDFSIISRAATLKFRIVADEAVNDKHIAAAYVGVLQLRNAVVFGACDGL